MKRALHFDLQHDEENFFLSDFSISDEKSSNSQCCIECGSPTKEKPLREEKSVIARDFKLAFDGDPPSSPSPPISLFSQVKGLVEATEGKNPIPQLSEIDDEEESVEIAKPKRRRHPPKMPTNYALRVEFTGERQLKWTHRITQNGKPVLVDKFTGRVFFVQ